MKNPLRLMALAATACVALSACALDPAGHKSANILNRSLVFSGPDSISKFYRIPGIVALPNGDLVAVADRRLEHNGDLPAKIDVIVRRSTDKGKTWSDAIEVVNHDEGGGYGDPAIGTAPDGSLIIVMTHGNGLWHSTPDNHAYIYVSRSTDGGFTWSKPKDITPVIFDPAATADSKSPVAIKGLPHPESAVGPVKCITGFAASGGMANVTLPGGKKAIAFAFMGRTDTPRRGFMSLWDVYSMDGENWWTVKTDIDPNADESKLVQCADGSLLQSVRNRDQGHRKFARSTDGGVTWTTSTPNMTLNEPACNGDILRLPGGELIHSIPDSPKNREKVSLYVSRDNGETWSKLIELTPGGSAYSAMTLLPDGTLGVLIEEDNMNRGYDIWFDRVDIQALLKDHK